MKRKMLYTKKEVAMKSLSILGVMLSFRCISLYSLTFFNLSSDTLELHARMDVSPESLAMHALLRPHTSITW